MSGAELAARARSIGRGWIQTGLSPSQRLIWLVGAEVLAVLAAAIVVASGYWHIALVMVFGIPAVIILHRYPYMAVVGWIILSPFLVQTPSSIERQIYWIIHRLLMPLTLGFMLIGAALRVNKRVLPRFRLPELAMLGYVLATTLSIMIQNDSPAATFIRFYDKVVIPMSLYWVLRLSLPGKNLLQWIFPVAVYLLVTQIGIGVLSWYMPHALPSQWLGYAGARTTGSLNSVSVYSTTIIFAALIVLYTALNTSHRWLRLALNMLVLAAVYAIFISYSRACWLAGMVVAFGVLLLYPRFLLRAALILAPVVALLAGLLLSSQLQTAQQRLRSESSDQAALSRLPVMVAAYRMFVEKPLTGWGYANFDRFDRRFQGRFGDLVNPDEKDLTSHNMYLTLLAEQGLVGFGLFLLPPALLLVQTVKVYNQLPRSGAIKRQLVSLLWLVLISHFVVNNFAPMVVVFGLGMWWLTLGWIAALVYSPRVTA